MGYNDYSDDAAGPGGSPDRCGQAGRCQLHGGHRRGAAPARCTNLDPKGLLFRRAATARNHPESVPVVLVLDQTGSMGSVVRQIQKSLRSIMGLLVQKKYLPHPHIMVIAVGDVPNPTRRRPGCRSLQFGGR